MIKKYIEFLNEKKETGINPDVIDVCNYIYDDLKKSNNRFEYYLIEDLSEIFSYMKEWHFNKIIVRINRKYQNCSTYVRSGRIACIYLKTLTKSSLNHEMIHVFQASKNMELLKYEYENEKILNQIKFFFRKNEFNINIIKLLFYLSDEHEIDAITHSFKKLNKKEQISHVSFFLLLRYFDIKKYTKTTNELNQFITIWMKYYNSNIPFFDRFKILYQVANNIIEINKEEVKIFCDKINEKFTNAGIKYLNRLKNQYSDTIEEMEKFVILQNDAKVEIQKNKINLIDLNFNIDN